MVTRKINKMPRPLYAAAGAGDLAYEKLCALPEKVSQLRGRVTELRPVVEDKVRNTDFGQVKVVAKRNAETVVHGAQVAQGRASAVYTDLVARGERVVRTAQSADLKASDASTEVVIDVAEADAALGVEPAVADQTPEPKAATKSESKPAGRRRATKATKATKETKEAKEAKEASGE